METDADRSAWQKLSEAHIAHNGHDEGGAGSPITKIVLEHYAEKWEEIFQRQTCELEAEPKNP